MARAELVGYPTGRWDADRTRRIIESRTIQAALVSFNRAILFEPDNVTARYRLGLIALGKDDFQDAILQLKRAQEAAPAHRGIRKVLGYVYTWTGQLGPAFELLVQVPEAQNETSLGFQLKWPFACPKSRID
jgi:predicted Zn-dependent protease